MSDDLSAETPMADRVASAVDMLRQGARMVLSDIPGDPSMMSGSFSGDTSRALAAEITRLRAQAEGFAGLLARAEEELRLIRMKDTGAVYDVGLRIDMSAALATYQQKRENGE